MEVSRARTGQGSHGLKCKGVAGPLCSRLRVKDLTQDLSRCRVVSLGGFASESIIGGEDARSTGSVPPYELAHDWLQGVAAALY